MSQQILQSQDPGSVIGLAGGCQVKGQQLWAFLSPDLDPPSPAEVSQASFTCRWLAFERKAFGREQFVVEKGDYSWGLRGHDDAVHSAQCCQHKWESPPPVPPHPRPRGKRRESPV